MNAKLLGLFSGFPSRQFTDAIAQRLAQELTVRESLVFVSAWPSEYARNDEDAAGMHAMFQRRSMAFRRYCVIDKRTSPEEAARYIAESSCIFLMGGNATQQYQLICEKGIREAIRSSKAVILGVSAGSINMAKRALDIWESSVPYEGLSLVNITVKAHITQDDQTMLHTLTQISEAQVLPICAMEDESAIFVQQGQVTYIGRIYWISKGKIVPFAPDLLCK